MLRCVGIKHDQTCRIDRLKGANNSQTWSDPILIAKDWLTPSVSHSLTHPISVQLGLSDT